MASNHLSSFKDDQRYRIVRSYLVVAIILFAISLLYFLLPLLKISCDLYMVRLLATFLWCLAFTIFGFWLLVRKICINDLGNDIVKSKIEKDVIRYRSFYPIYLLFLAFLVTAIIELKFNELGKKPSLILAAPLAFFLGFFVDNPQHILDKLRNKFKSE